ncbi:MAG: carbon storage regulator [Pirellulales bacterium]|nr:carbon storage regulator [Pirellulales bacterium]
MLVLTRKIGERIWIGDDICITVVKLAPGGVRLGIEAPPHLSVIREELRNQLHNTPDTATENPGLVPSNKPQDGR